MPELLTIPYRDHRGAAARTRCLRQGHGRALLLIHGVGMRAEVWEPQLDFLSGMYEVLAIDMPGHGLASRPPADATLDDYVAAALAVLDHCAVGRAHVIGHSMGALVALELALKHPERVHGVIAMNAVFCRSETQRAAVSARVEALQEPSASIDWEPTIERWFDGSSSDPAVDRVRSLLRMNDAIGYERTYRLFAQSDTVHRDRLKSLAVPALFLTGELDPNSNSEMSAAMATLAPRGRCEIVAGERHMMAVAAPERVNPLVAAFLAEVDGAGSRARVDVRSLRKALGSFATGVTVVTTTDDDGAPRGFTANSFTSVSLDPPLVLVCIAKSAASCKIFSRAEHFSVNVLSQAQADISTVFATKAADKFSRIAWHAGAHSAPLIENTAASFECRRYEVREAGDHVLLIGEVLVVEDRPSTPLAYCRGAYVDLKLDVDVISQGAARMRVGALLEQDGMVLLERLSAHHYDLPWAARLGDDADRASLKGRLGTEGVEASIDFVFAVFEDREKDVGTVVYRGVLESALATSPRFVAFLFDEIPWDDIADTAVAAMLHRYIDERRADLFGIYSGDAERGVVRRLARSSMTARELETR